jgi:hypothetical protein
MKLEEIIKMYGTGADYYDMNTGYIYKLPQMSDPDENGLRTVPVNNEDGDTIGVVRVKI